MVPPCTTSSVYDGARAVPVTPAARALLVTGRSCGPDPSWVSNREIVRSHGTVPPATASTASPEAPKAVRSRPRRVSPGSGRSPSSTGRLNADRITGSFTATCRTSAPKATQATA